MPPKKKNTPPGQPKTPRVKAGKRGHAAQTPNSPPSIQANHEEDQFFPVVGIGASAGGLSAVTAFLNNLPAKTGVAYILAQHRAPTVKDDILISLLKNQAAIAVVEAGDGAPLMPDVLHVPPAGYLMGVFKRRMQLFKEEPGQRERLPIDFFFRSLGEDLKEQAGAVVLSGADTDGSLGIKAVKGLGGLVVVQDPATAEFSIMPASAAQTGVADFILPPEKMPERIVGYFKRMAAAPGADISKIAESPQNDLDKILLTLRANTANDFSSYKSKTVLRRIKRRMDLHRIDRMRDYNKLLKENPKETQDLFKDLLIGVTTFFRDPEAFTALKEELKAYLAAQPKAKRLLRFWVPACSSGEEAYSLGIIAKEAILESGRDFAVQIYATDLDSQTIDIARQGLYPPNIAQDVPGERLARFFLKTEAGFKIRPEIREMIVFSVQNVLQDPPFSRLDLVCCRNLLIYLNPSAQHRVLSMFHYALLEDSLLFLGTSESVSNLSSLFQEKDKRWRIYTRVPSMRASYIVGQSSLFPLPMAANSETGRHAVEPAAIIDLKSVAERFILDNCTPVSLLVTQTGEILHTMGKTGKYLELPPGKPATNIFAMAREGLKAELTTAIGLASSLKNEPVTRHALVKVNGGSQALAVSVRYVMTSATGHNLLLVSFQDMDKPKKRKKAGSANGTLKSSYDLEMEQELQAMRENLQAVSEEYATTTEELKSMNEELQSSNEELQSTNEEMETAKEELQSINEEQVTLNSELQSKIDELSVVNNDMTNLLAGTDIATLFLDTELNIKRFTPATQKILNLIHTDIGRPVSHIATNLNYESMVEEARQVMDTLRSKEIEVRHKDGAWYQMRILPYRTMDNIIAGLVLTFNDISQLKISEQKANDALRLAENIVDAVEYPLVALGTDMTVVMANAAYYRAFKSSPKDTVGRAFLELGHGVWDAPRLWARLEEAIREKKSFDNFALEYAGPGGTKGKMLLNARLIETAAGEGTRFLLAFSPVNHDS
jgi:two-component system CheB/CheR fusion protein